jgi:hypothetical protein
MYPSVIYCRFWLELHTARGACRIDRLVMNGSIAVMAYHAFMHTALRGVATRRRRWSEHYRHVTGIPMRMLCSSDPRLRFATVACTHCPRMLEGFRTTAIQHCFTSPFQRDTRPLRMCIASSGLQRDGRTFAVSSGMLAQRRFLFEASTGVV